MSWYTIKLNNFGIHRDSAYNFPSSGVTLIKGRNGAGKSTVLDAVYHTLVPVSTATKNSLARKYSASPASCVMETQLWYGNNLVKTAQCKITVNRRSGKLSVGRGTWDSNPEMDISIGNNLLLNSVYLRQFCLADTSMLSDYFRGLIKDTEFYDKLKCGIDEKLADIKAEVSVMQKRLNNAENEYSEELSMPGVDLDAMMNVIKQRNEHAANINKYEQFQRDQDVRRMIADIPVADSYTAQELSTMQRAWQLKQRIESMETTIKKPSGKWSLSDRLRSFMLSNSRIDIFAPDFDPDHELLCKDLEQLNTCACCGKPCIKQNGRIVHREDADLSVLKSKPRPLRSHSIQQISTMMEYKKMALSAGITSMNDVRSALIDDELQAKWNEYESLKERLSKAPAGYDKYPQMKDAEDRKQQLMRLIKFPHIKTMKKPILDAAGHDSDIPDDVSAIYTAKKMRDMGRELKELEAQKVSQQELMEVKSKVDKTASKCMGIILEVYNERLTQIIASFEVPLSMKIVIDDSGAYDIVDTHTGASWRMLSGGQQMMVSIALTIALSMDTPFPFMLIDESFSCISEDIKEKIIETFRMFCPHKSVLVVDHDGVEGMYDHCVNI